MSHSHTHETPKTLSRLILAIVINVGIVIFEIILGILSNSLALISDAFHNITDISSMVLGYISEKTAVKPANNTKTYGYKKIEFVTAFVNGLILMLATIYIFYEGILRLFNPTEVVSSQMFYVGIVAVIGNGLATWILSRDSQNNTNMKAVWLHSLQDALLSLGVIVGAVIIHFTGWNIIDPIISIFISLFLAKSIYYLIKETVNALIDSVPENIDYEKVRKDLENIKGVEKVSDLHIWLESSHLPMLSVHLQIKNLGDLEEILAKAQNLLHKNHEIEHTTIQIVPQNPAKFSNCHHCN